MQNLQMYVRVKSLVNNTYGNFIYIEFTATTK